MPIKIVSSGAKQAPKVVAPKAVKAVKVTPTKMPKQLAKIQALCAKLNKEMDGLGYIGVGSDVHWLDPARIRTGILGFDVLSSGGLPRRSMTHLWGPNSVAKTTTLLMMMAAAQRRGQNSLYAPSETFSKMWARKIGNWIPHDPKEYEGLERIKSIEDRHEARAQMEEYDRGVPGLGQFALLLHPFGDGLLEGAYQAIESNVFDIVGVDSLAACKPAKLIKENEVGDDERGSGKQIQMLIQFCNKVNSAFGKRYGEDGAVSPKTGGTFFNETAVVCINQALQDQTPVMGPMRGATGIKYKPSMGVKLMHYWNLSVEFKRGYLDLDEAVDVRIDGEKQGRQKAGIEVNAYCDKSRVGTPYRTALWHLYTREHDGHHPGTVDTSREIRVWGVHYNVIEQDGAWYTMPGGRRVNGKDKVDAILAEDAALRREVEDEVIERCRQ